VGRRVGRGDEGLTAGGMATAGGPKDVAAVGTRGLTAGGTATAGGPKDVAAVGTRGSALGGSLEDGLEGGDLEDDLA
jgi:hypothetical protein